MSLSPLHPRRPPPRARSNRTRLASYVGVASLRELRLPRRHACRSTPPASCQNEYYTWLNSDRHAGAYNVLFNDRSARIARNMRLARRPYQEKRLPRLPLHERSAAISSPAASIVEDGVQCEACHGPASGWRAEHTQQGWTHAQSVARGMIDLRDLRVRAHGCDSLPRRQRREAKSITS